MKREAQTVGSNRGRKEPRRLSRHKVAFTQSRGEASERERALEKRRAGEKLRVLTRPLLQ